MDIFVLIFLFHLSLNVETPEVPGGCLIRLRTQPTDALAVAGQSSGRSDIYPVMIRTCLVRPHLYLYSEM
jgi:hypothetical protein